MHPNMHYACSYKYIIDPLLSLWVIIDILEFKKILELL